MIIGLAGMAGSGKDTVADAVVERGFTRVALADPVKRLAREVYDFTVEQLWGPSPERSKPDKRYPRNHTFPKDSTVCLCCGWDGGELVRDGGKPPQCYLTPRFAIQQLGTEWGRGCYLDTWVDYTVRVAKRLLECDQAVTYGYDPTKGLMSYDRWEYGNMEPEGVIISDIRFRNELEAIRAAGSKLWRVVRPGHDKPKWDHTSETEQQGFSDDEFNVVIKNTGTVESLHELVTKTLIAAKELG